MEDYSGLGITLLVIACLVVVGVIVGEWFDSNGVGQVVRNWYIY